MRSVVLLRAASSIVVLLAILPMTGSAPAPISPVAVLPDTGRYVLSAEGTEARFRVRETLASLDFPSDAIGKTNKVEGQIVIDPKGAIVRDQSKFTVDATSLVSDSNMRDNYIRRNTLQTAQYPNFVFVPTELRGLRFPLPAAGDVTFQLVGDFTVRDQTKPITWEVTAKVAQGIISGQANTKFTFADFAMTKPRVARVLSMEDEIKLELDFRLVPAAAGSR